MGMDGMDDGWKCYSRTPATDWPGHRGHDSAREKPLCQAPDAKIIGLTPSPSLEIAAKTAFNNPEHFSVLFKAKTGLPPGEFRKRARQGRGQPR